MPLSLASYLDKRLESVGFQIFFGLIILDMQYKIAFVFEPFTDDISFAFLKQNTFFLFNHLRASGLNITIKHRN